MTEDNRVGAVRPDGHQAGAQSWGQLCAQVAGTGRGLGLSPAISLPSVGIRQVTVAQRTDVTAQSRAIGLLGIVGR